MFSQGFWLPVNGSLCIPRFLVLCKFMMLFVIQIDPPGHCVHAIFLSIFDPELWEKYLGFFWKFLQPEKLFDREQLRELSLCLLAFNILTPVNVEL